MPKENLHFEFPKDPELRLQAALNSVNSELKQAILLTIGDVPRTYNEIYKDLSRLSHARLPTAQAIRSHLVDTLVPSGFIDLERLTHHGRTTRTYFQLSNAGREFGVAIAAFSLRYAVDQNMSLRDLLGQAGSGGESKSPYNRFRIIEFVSRGPCQIVELTQQLQLQIEDVRQHLEKLAALEVLEYNSLDFGRGAGIKPYLWVKGKVPEEAHTVGELKTLTRDVAKTLFRIKAADRITLCRILHKKHPEQMSTVLSGLLSQGLVHTRFHSQAKSRVVPLKRCASLSEYIREIRNAVREEASLKKMQEMHQGFVRKSRLLGMYLKAGIELYRVASPNLKPRSLESRTSELVHFVARFSKGKKKGLRPVEVVRGLGWSHGNVTRLLRVGVSRGLLTKTTGEIPPRYSTKVRI